MKLFKLITFYILITVNTLHAQMQLDWVRRYSGPGNYEDSGNAICVDDSGNVYVTGIVEVGSIYKCTTIKYNKFGDSVWVRDFQRLGNYFNAGNDITVDDSGNVFVAGAISVIKYDNFGKLKWSKYDSTNFNKIILDTSGNIYASGMGNGSFVTVKYDKNGTRVWKNSGYQAYRLHDMELDKAGNVIITGMSEYTGTYDYSTIKYSNDGNLKWIRTYNGPAPHPSYDLSYAVTTDNSGNVYVTGASMNETTYFNCVTIKYDSLGNVIWIKRLPDNIADSGHDILVDSSQNVYIAAWLNGHTSTIKLNQNGDIIWSRVFPEGSGIATNFPVIILDSINNIYVTAIAGSMRADYAAVKYDNNGNEIFVVTYSNTPISYDYAYDMTLDKKGNLYLTGTSQGSYYDYATLKFSPIITSISANNIQPNEFKLEQNYPNPFNPSTKIKYTLPKEGIVKITIYNSLGQRVTELVNEFKQPGAYISEFNARLAEQGVDLPSGIYFYRFESNGIVMTGRMLLIK